MTLSRLLSFYRSHGLRSTAARCAEAFRRLSFAGRMVLFSCTLPAPQANPLAGFSLDRSSAATLAKAEYLQVFGATNTAAREEELAVRFAAGSQLWLARSNGELAAYGWTIQGTTVAPHFFPLEADEVHFFDFFVAPAFRGQGINVALMNAVLAQLGSEPVCRVHLECAAWNAAQLRSLHKTVFRPCGQASLFRLWRRSLVIWH